MQFNYAQNSVIVGRKYYPMDLLRMYFLQNYYTLCANCFLKSIMIGGNRVFTYDWSHIFEIGLSSGNITNELLSELKQPNTDMNNTSNTKKVSMKDIELALKPNFVWEKDNPKHRLETSIKIEKSKLIGLVVFIGICHFNGYPKKEIMDYLDIKKIALDRYLHKFLEYYNQAQAVMENPALYAGDEEAEMCKKMVVKYEMISNALRLLKPNERFISLADISF